MVLKLLVAAVVVTPLALLVVQAVRGRARVQACCSLPAESDARMRAAYAEDVPADAGGAVVTSPPAP